MSTPKVKEKKIGKKQIVETQELHCSRCGRFLCYYAIVWGLIRTKCPICKEWTTIDISPDHKI